MPSKTYFFSVLIGYLFPILTGHAQLKSGRHFQAIAMNEAIVNSLWYYSKGNKETLSVSQILRSQDYAYDAASTISFYGERIDEEGNPIPEAIAQIPPEASRLLLLFIKRKEPDLQGLTYRIVTLPDSTEDFEFGSFKFINATNGTLAIAIGEEKFLLNKSEIKVIPIAASGNESLYLRVMRQEENDTWRACYSNSWGHRSDMRTLVFMVNNEDGEINTLRYRQFEPRN